MDTLTLEPQAPPAFEVVDFDHPRCRLAVITDGDEERKWYSFEDPNTHIQVLADELLPSTHSRILLLQTVTRYERYFLKPNGTLLGPV